MLHIDIVVANYGAGTVAAPDDDIDTSTPLGDLVRENLVQRDAIFGVCIIGRCAPQITVSRSKYRKIDIVRIADFMREVDKAALILRVFSIVQARWLGAGRAERYPA